MDPLLGKDLEFLRLILQDQLAYRIPNALESAVLIGFFWDILRGDKVVLPLGMFIYSQVFSMKYSKPLNQLLKAVYSDVQVLEFVAGCCTLGLIHKIIIGPLWQVLESPNVTILEMNAFFNTL